MSDLISRAELFNRLAPVQTLEDAYAVIQNMPTVETKRPRGKWIKFPHPFEVYQCTNCGASTPQRWALGLNGCKTLFCPWCGARMEDG